MQVWMIHWKTFAVGLLAGLFCSLSSGTVIASSVPPLSAKEKQLFWASLKQDKLNKKPCKGRRRVTLHCRDKLHYVYSNEARHDVWRPFLRGLGGGYVGVGTDQNFTLIALAKSRLVWLFDYDPVAVWMNLIHRAMIVKSPTRAGYRARWYRKYRRKNMALLRTFYKGHPDQKKILWVFRNWRGSINAYLRRRNKIHLRLLRKKKPLFSHWLDRKETYQYVRQMFLQRRIRILKGDLLRNNTMRNIGRVSHALKMPVRALYLSNAEQFWPFVKAYKNNVKSLLMDRRSLVLRTLGTSRFGAPLEYVWIYITQKGRDFQKRIGHKKMRSIWRMVKPVRRHKKGVYKLGFPR